MFDWVIIGGGDVVRRKSGAAFAIPGRSRVAGLWRRRLMDAETTRAAIGAAAAFDDVDQMLALEHVGAVYVATPPGARLAFARKIAAAGLPAYFEKPLARNAAEAAEIVQMFDAAGAPLFVACYRRAWAKFAAVKALFRADALGGPRRVAYRLDLPAETFSLGGWMADPALSGGGKIFDLAPHMLDLMDYLFGAVTLTSATSRGAGRVSRLEEQACFAFETASGATGTGDFNIARRRATDRLQIDCPAGRIETSLYDHAPILITGANGPRRIECAAPPLAQGPMIDALTAHLAGKPSGPPPPSLTTGAAALNAARLLDGILSDAYDGRDRPFWLERA